MSADSSLERERLRRPLAVDLARLLAMAVRIEPELLRAVRLECLPSADVGLESDFWFGPLVQGRGSSGITLRPAVREALLDELKTPEYRTELLRSWPIIERMHREAPPVMRLEEKVASLVLLEEFQEANRLLGGLLLSLNEDRTGGLAEWVSRRLPLMPREARSSEPGLVLEQAASAKLRARAGPESMVSSNAGPPPSLATIVPRKLIALQFVTKAASTSQKTEGALEIREHHGPTDTPSIATIGVPHTNPLFVEIEVPTAEGWTRHRLMLNPGSTLRTPVPLGPVVRVHSATGEQRTLRPKLPAVEFDANLDDFSPALLAIADEHLRGIIAIETQDLSWQLKQPHDESVLASLVLIAKENDFLSEVERWRSHSARVLVSRGGLIFPGEHVADANLSFGIGDQGKTFRTELRKHLLQHEEAGFQERMTATRQIEAAGPMGANLTHGGATFRVWGPRARSVEVVGHFNGRSKHDRFALARQPDGCWLGFSHDVKDGDTYRYWVRGESGREGFKRDPYARELTGDRELHCVVRDPNEFSWHDTNFVPAPFQNNVIYELHVGAFHPPRSARRGGTFLDVVDKIPHLAELGVTAVQLLPIAEFSGPTSMGYNCTDFYAPARNYAVPDHELSPYVSRCNELLVAKGLPPHSAASLRGPMRQLKALVDLLHVHGLAVFFELVLSHAGGGFGEAGVFNFDLAEDDALFLSERGYAGGRIFSFWKSEVRRFLIENASYWLDEFHVDGFRYDSAVAIQGEGNGWQFLQELTGTIRRKRPSFFQYAGYLDPHALEGTAEGGAGLDGMLTANVRMAVRAAIGQASQPDRREVAMVAVGAAILSQATAWAFRGIQALEDHDVVSPGREPRLPPLADPGNARSWYARSRSRVATALSLTAPGIPMLFMGQELMEDKPWSEDTANHPELQIPWEHLETDRGAQDFYRCVRELVRLRRELPGLTGQGFQLIHSHDANRVMAWHRWVPGIGHDVVIVACLADQAHHSYRIGLPVAGPWREAFNSDVYDNWVNPNVTGNNGRVQAISAPFHQLDFSTELVLPANAVLILIPEPATQTPHDRDPNARSSR